MDVARAGRAAGVDPSLCLPSRSTASLADALLNLSDVTLDAVERLAPLAQQSGVRLVVEALPEVNLLGDRAAGGAGARRRGACAE